MNLRTGLGALTPAIQPLNMASLVASQQMPQMAPQASLSDRFRAGLGKLGQGLFPVDPSIPPEQAQALQRNALMQLGLGMLGTASQGGRFGESLAAGFMGASNTFQGALQRAYQNALAARAEKREMEREEKEDERYEREFSNKLEQQKLEDERYRTEQEFRRAQAELAQDRWKRQMDSLDKYREQQLQLQEARIGRGLSESQKIQAADRVRKEYIDRKQKVADSTLHAEKILELTADPNRLNDPAVQTAIGFSFGKMLDPDSVVRESEFKVIQNTRGLAEEIQNLIPRLSQGARFTPQQIMRIRDVAITFGKNAAEREKALNEFYSELAQRRGIDPFEVIGRSYEPEKKRTETEIDAGPIFGSGLSGLDESGEFIEVPY